MKLQPIMAAVAAAVVCAAGPAGAATIFSDDFNGIASSELNAAPTGWVIEGDGTVDLIANGGFGIQCAGNAGGCIDLDGSTNNAGRLRTVDSVVIMPGTVYTLSADVSGNQRNSGEDAFAFGLLVVDGLVEIELGSVSALAGGAPFATYSGMFEDSQSFAAYIYFDAAGGDNIGPILDNVLFATADEPPPSSVPEPGPAGLLLSALIACAAFKRLSVLIATR